MHQLLAESSTKLFDHSPKATKNLPEAHRSSPNTLQKLTKPLPKAHQSFQNILQSTTKILLKCSPKPCQHLWTILQKVCRNYLNILQNLPTDPSNLIRGITQCTLLNILNYAIIFSESLVINILYTTFFITLILSDTQKYSPLNNAVSPNYTSTQGPHVPWHYYKERGQRPNRVLNML